ncbi:MAG: sugar nucleotide-binding protein [Candidatus Pelagadaptatus aseana]|uniref:sugar nucleotide-binding protein n=1 Tax=Candidatus Pelagadaptatus aseana TaxID=3120508 RepID=UPI0039B3147E
MATRIVITDAYSSLGQAILRGFEHTQFSILIPKSHVVDWCDEHQVQEYLDAHSPQLIINTVGWSEYPTESQREQLVQAAGNIARMGRRYACDVIHLSSFRVFGGENKSSYDEADRPSPLGPAGRSYWEAERIFEQHLQRYLCIRVGWLLDVHSDTLLSRLLSGLLAESPCAVTDQRMGTPIGLQPLVKVVVSITNQILCGAENWGVVHYACGDACSVEELAEALVDHLRDDHNMSRDLWFVEVEDEEHPLLAKEPVSAALTMRRCRDDFGVQHKSWRQGLGNTVSQYLELHNSYPVPAAD